MRILCLSARDLQEALDMADLIEDTKCAFAALATGGAHAPTRIAVHTPEHDATTLLMGARVDGIGLAAKVVSIFPQNRLRDAPVVTGLVTVHDPATGTPIALCEGSSLTAWRTGAATGVATDLLARKDAKTAALIGCGAQAPMQLRALAAVRPLSTVRVFAPRQKRAWALVESMRDELSASLEVAPSANAAMEGADIVCTATTSKTPVFDGARLAAGTHINAIGSFTLAMCELDATTVGRSFVFVDSVDAVLEEAGDLMHAEREGATRRDAWIELGSIAAGHTPGRIADGDITLFKSVGHAVQDVAAAARAVRIARERGLGQEIEL